ncbi:MAG TPA: M20/M25/M40 family metallo-hydrolase [Bryobacteraceae bacterium]|nr:M20/M25/M40 family metallo-hydrolase [Bryobacteraceae bacterium]
MDVFALTRTLIDIESITGNEKAVGDWVFDFLQPMAAEYGGTVEKIEVEPGRNNVLATWGDPVVTLSTHLDTVPPFFPSREDEESVWGRGACDVKGIIACMILAAKELLAEGRRGVALLFVVGEERNSAGAYFMAKQPRGSKYLINGEPTSCQLALGSKGALRYELVASGRMAHSAYPELGESAIEKLLDALERLRKVEWPVHPILGPSTLNIGTITGGRAPNVVPDSAKAELLIRLVDDPEPVRRAVEAACAGLVEPKEQLCIPSILMESRPGFETAVMKYTTDIPAFDGAWGKPLLLGPGTIHVAHTSQERVPKAELLKATGLYAQLVRQLLEEGKNEA